MYKDSDQKIEDTGVGLTVIITMLFVVFLVLGTYYTKGILLLVVGGFAATIYILVEWVLPLIGRTIRLLFSSK